MQSDLPKVLHPLAGKPLVLHVIQSIREAGIDDIILVVGFKGNLVADAAGPSVRIAWQHEQRGTGHAVMQAEPMLGGFSGLVLVACGDVPLIRPATLRDMIHEAEKPGVKAVVLTMSPENPFGYGRIMKNSGGDLIGIVEEKDASPEQKLVREVNTGTYIFHSEFLFDGLKTITTNNAQGEYYLPDVLGFIRSSGGVVRTVHLADAIEGSGINSPAELERLERFVQGTLIN